jgi:lipoprotein LprG
MQTRPRNAVRILLLLVTVLVTAAALATGCSSKKEEDAKPLPDAATLLTQANETTRAQQTVHLKLMVDGEIPELPIAKLDGDLANVPAVGATGTADIIFLGSPIKDVGFTVADGTLYAAMTPGSWQSFGPAADIYDVSAILNPDTGLANVLANFSDAKADGREAVDGVEGVKVTGNVTADAVNKIAPQIGATGPVPAVAWIKEDGDHQLVQARLEPTPGNTITMTTTDWGKPVTVTVPPVSP